MLITFLVPLILFAGLCFDSARRLSERRPEIKRCLSNPERYDGRTVWVGGERVSQPLPEGFLLVYDGRPVRVHSNSKPKPGCWVSMRGTFRKPNVIDAAEVREEPNYGIQRAGVYGISLIVLAVWLVFFFKRFRLGIRSGLFHPRKADA